MKLARVVGRQALMWRSEQNVHGLFQDSSNGFGFNEEPTSLVVTVNISVAITDRVCNYPDWAERASQELEALRGLSYLEFTFRYGDGSCAGVGAVCVHVCACVGGGGGGKGVEGGGWRVEGGGWRAEGGGWRVFGSVSGAAGLVVGAGWWTVDTGQWGGVGGGDRNAVAGAALLCFPAATGCLFWGHTSAWPQAYH